MTEKNDRHDAVESPDAEPPSRRDLLVLAALALVVVAALVAAALSVST